jgi:putative sterol carrier protein
VRASRRSHGPRVPVRRPAPEQSLRVNQVITDSPFGSDPVEMYLDTSEGVPHIDRGHLPEADITVTTDYDTAKELFVADDPQAAMQAFMSGRVAVEGDIAKMLAVQASNLTRSELQIEVAQRLRDITAP